MVIHSLKETLIASISALIYGVIFSVLIEFITFVFLVVRTVIFDEDILCIGKIKEKNSIVNSDCKGETPFFPKALSIVLFGLFFILHAFCTLDGNVRLYSLVIMLISYKLCRRFILSKIGIMSLKYIIKAKKYAIAKIKKLLSSLKKHKCFAEKGQNEHTKPTFTP